MPPMPNSENSAAGHDYGNLQKHLNPNPLQRWLLTRFHRRVVEVACQADARRVLDAGCGQGFVMHQLDQDGLAGSITGADLDTVALAWGRAHEITQQPLTGANVRCLPFPDNKFDLVLCLEVLEHLPRPAEGLRELLRVSGHYILLSVPHEPFFRGINFARGKHIKALGNDPEHLQLFTGRAFRRLVADQARLIWHGYSFPWQIALAAKHDLPNSKPAIQ
jgi:SAM-dependent methyltransferase